MKMIIKDKHNFGVIESDLHFEAAICDKGPKQRLMTISQLSLILNWQGKRNVGERLHQYLESSSTCSPRHVIMEKD